MSQDKRYAKPFLREVIARIDYATPVVSISEGLPKDVSKQALMFFPILEPKEIISQDLLVSQQTKEERTSILREWHFFGKNREKHLAITPQTFFISYKKYESFEKLKEEFLGIANLLFKDYNELQGRRFGLRYINSITDIQGDLTDWSQYLNENLLSIFNIPQTGDIVTRAFHNLALKYDDVNLNFQYGMHNPDFPAPMTQKVFVLDLDAYYQGPLEYTDVVAKIDTFHEKIQQLFEHSIKENLRELMGVE